MADRFHAPDLAASDRIVLDGDEARHLARVARRSVGDVVEVFDGLGLGVRARVEAIGKDRVELARLEPVPDRVGPLDLTLCVAPPKGDRLDWLVEKATELGVARLVPIRAARSVVDPRPSKLDRLRRAVIEASKQCGRSRLMELAEPRSFAEMVRGETATIRLLAEQGGAVPAGLSAGAPVALAIGPEGGWTEAERGLAREAGWGELDLGATRLRVETAAIVGAAVLFAGVRRG